MIIQKAKFVKSSTKISECPKANLPEYAFIGRSNVGKSSLINMLVDRKKLAKTSTTPGKTQLINHFLIDEKWYLTDLPGYGYAKTSKENRKDWKKMIENFLQHRESLMCVFVLIDSRIEPQKIDLEFMEWLGKKEIPFVIVFTKIDKLSSGKLNKNLKTYKARMLKTWAFLPQTFSTSSTSKHGKTPLLDLIEETNLLFTT